MHRNSNYSGAWFGILYIIWSAGYYDNLSGPNCYWTFDWCILTLHRVIKLSTYFKVILHSKNKRGPKIKIFFFTFHGLLLLLVRYQKFEQLKWEWLWLLMNKPVRDFIDSIINQNQWTVCVSRIAIDVARVKPPVR